MGLAGTAADSLKGAAGLPSFWFPGCPPQARVADVALMQWLADHGADAHAERTSDGATAVHFASSSEGGMESKLAALNWLDRQASLVRIRAQAAPRGLWSSARSDRAAHGNPRGWLQSDLQCPGFGQMAAYGLPLFRWSFGQSNVKLQPSKTEFSVS